MNFKEFNDKCQKKNYKTVGNWMVRHIERPLALYLTWLIVKLPVSAHHITLFTIGLSYVAAGYLMKGSVSSLFVGMWLWQLWYLFDHVDGQVARYRGTSSIEGQFFDFIMHHIATILLHFSFGVAAYRNCGSLTDILAGFFASMGMLMIALLNDSAAKAMQTRFFNFERAYYAKRQAVEQLGFKKPSKPSLARKLFSLCHKCCEGHVAMNLLTLFVTLRFIYPFTFGGYLPLRLIIWFYAVLANFVWIAKITHILKTKSITSEFESNYKWTNPPS